MLKQDDYRKSAAECFVLARRAVSGERRKRLQALAEAWLDLADHAEQLKRRRTPREHPLIRAKLGPPPAGEQLKSQH